MMISCRNNGLGVLPRLAGPFGFLFEAGDGLIDLAQLTLDVLQRINVMNGAKTFVQARSAWKRRRQLHVAISKGGLLELGDRHGGHLFQPCDQIEIMAMARRAAVRDRHAMLGLTAS